MGSKDFYNLIQSNLCHSLKFSYPLLSDTGTQEACNDSRKRNEPSLLPLGTRQNDAFVSKSE